MSTRPKRSSTCGEDAVHLGLLGQVGAQSEGHAPRRFDLRRGALGGFWSHVDDHDGGAGGGQAGGRHAAERTTATGHDGHSAGQVEEGRNVGHEGLPKVEYDVLSCGPVGTLSTIPQVALRPLYAGPHVPVPRCHCWRFVMPAWRVVMTDFTEPGHAIESEVFAASGLDIELSGPRSPRPAAWPRPLTGPMPCWCSSRISTAT